jgi:hypothetical protein
MFRPTTPFSHAAAAWARSCAAKPFSRQQLLETAIQLVERPRAVVRLSARKDS